MTGPRPEGRTVKSGATIEVKVSQCTELGTIPVVMGKDPDTVGIVLSGQRALPRSPGRRSTTM